MNKKYFLFSSVLFFSFVLFTGDNEEVKKQNEIFSQFFSELNQYYVDSLNSEVLMRTAEDAILKSLDPYSYFVSDKEQEANRKSWQGVSFAGFGVNILQQDSEIVITEIKENYPAQRGGLRCGDIILSADGYSFHGLITDSVVKHLRGEADTPAALKIRRDKKEFTVKLIRQEIRNRSVAYAGMIDETTGYVLFTHFLEGSAQNLRDSVEKLKKNGMQKLILDIRGNSGGLVDEAVRAVNIFIPKNNNVVSYKGRAKEWNSDNKTFGEPLDSLMPVVVITDGGSISAAEILAGAMQDYDRAVLIGRKTFGKGFVQGTRFLPYGNSFYMTSARYHTPSGRCIQELDYSKRDSKGNPTHISDSLKKEFHTQNGRKVFDTGGIVPDILVEQNHEPAIIQSLRKENLITDFAIEFRKKHDSIPPVSQFHINETIFNDFRNYLAGKKYAFYFPEETSLKTFADKAKEEHRFENIENDFNRLTKNVEKNKIAELEKFKREIITELEKEIILKYYYNSGRIRYSLKADKDVNEAISVLKNKEKYNSLLNKK